MGGHQRVEEGREALLCQRDKKFEEDGLIRQCRAQKSELLDSRDRYDSHTRSLGLRPIGLNHWPAGFLEEIQKSRQGVLTELSVLEGNNAIDVLW